MVDEQQPQGESAPFHCPWCSAILPASDLETCPSCGAALTSTNEAALPGVTAIDHEAIARGAREPVRQSRSKLLSWLSGEYATEEAAPTGAIAPPDPAVRREMLRLRIEAEIADRQAEADAMMADAAVEGRPFPGLPGSPIEEPAESEVGAEAETEAAAEAAVEVQAAAETEGEAADGGSDAGAAAADAERETVPDTGSPPTESDRPD
jgi:hypothetical protein